MQRYEFLDHPADLKIRAYGKDLAELFVNAALGMAEFLYGHVQPKKLVYQEIKVEALDLEALLLGWLAELLCLSDTNKRAYINFDIKEISSVHIVAEVGSCPAEAQEEIKAVTMHELEILNRDDQWQATVVYDL